MAVTNSLGTRLITRYRATPPTVPWSQIISGHSPFNFISDRDFGLTMLLAYDRGDATVSDLEGALLAGWITQAEYDATVGTNEPDPAP